MKKLLASIFILLLFLPAVVWLTGMQFDCDVERIGYERPKFSGKMLLDSKFYRAFDRYFNDRFSLQGPLLLAKRWLDYKLFRTTDAENIHVGSEHWLYHRQSVDDYRIDACKLKAEMARAVLSLHALEAMLRSADRKLVLMVAPNKSTVFPEYLGNVPREGHCRRSFYEIFLQTMGRHGLQGFVRLDEPLKDAKTQGGAPIYVKDSRFWGPGGAAVALERLLQTLDRRPADVSHSATPARMPLDDLRRRLLGTSVGEPMDSHRRLVGNAEPTLPAAVVYGDGFIEPLLPDLSAMVRRLDVLPIDRVPSVQFGESLADYELVLLEVSETRLKSLLIDTTRIFQSLKGELGHMKVEPVAPQTLHGGPGTSLQPANEQVVLRSAGGHASLVIEGLPGSSNAVFRMLKFSVSSHQSARWTLEFRGDWPYRIQETLHAGTSEFFVPLPFGSSISLTVQPGQRPALFVFEAIQVVSFADPPAEPPRESRIFAGTPSRNSARTIFEVVDPWLQTGRTAHAGPPAVDPEPGGDVRQPPRQTAEDIAGDGIQTAEVSKVLQEPSRLQKNTSHRETEMSARSNQPSAVPAADAQTQSPSSLTLTEFADGRIFQRIADQADITVSGRYIGEPGAVEARVRRYDNDQAVVLPWTEIDPRPQNGMFVGVLPQVPQGGWYRLEVRNRANPTRIVAGRNRWGVGMLVACIGQSNMKEWFRTGEDLRADPLLRKFSSAGWEPFADAGNGAIAFGNRIVERLGIPVGVMDFAVDGSGLRREADWGVGYWQDTSPGSIYQRFVAGVSDAGGALEFVVWTQGEADAARGTVTEKEYGYSLESFIQRQVRADIRNASVRPHLPFLIVSMIKRPYGKDEPHQGIRNAQHQVADQLVDCYLAATTLDLENLGKEHLAPGAYITLGQRVSQAVLYALGLESYHRGPEVAGAARIDATTVDVSIRHRGGSDFQPRSGVSGWEVITLGAPVPIESVSRLDSQTLRIALARPLEEPARIRYLFGALPDVRRAVRDNSTLQLPLEEYQGAVRMEPFRDESIAQK